MTTELQNKIWSCLPKEARDEIKNLYSAHTKRQTITAQDTLLDRLFGRDNLTSNVGLTSNKSDCVTLTVRELKEALCEFPDDLNLRDIKTTLQVYKSSSMNRIESAYLADHRIAGREAWGVLTRMERQTDLEAVAKSLLTGLKFNRIISQ